jgi:xanthine dehydrogenase accessory factor
MQGSPSTERSELAERILVRGAGDVGSAIAHALSLLGWQVVIHDVPEPAHPRRGMSFADAYFEGYCILDDIAAQRCDDLESLRRRVKDVAPITVTALPFDGVLQIIEPDVLVDARMRKRSRAEPQQGLAAFTIGIGPGFTAGRTVDRVIESARGDRLGAIIDSGEAESTLSEPSVLGGVGRGRFVYAPSAGCFRTDHRIGQGVTVGETVAMIADANIQSPQSGEIRGLVHDGAHVTTGAKVLEVIPAGAAACFGIGGRPARIAAGVVRAITDTVAPRPTV